MSSKLLIVNNSHLESLKINNALKDFNLLNAKDAYEAIDQIQNNSSISIIILDFDFYNIECYKIISFLNTDFQYKKIRIIFISNLEQAQIEFKGLITGSNNYLQKPFNDEQLKAKVKINLDLFHKQSVKENEHIVLLNAIFDQAPIGISISYENEPSKSNLLKVNPMFKQITGRTQEELKKLGWVNITHPDDLEEDLKNYKLLKKGEIKAYTMEKRFIKPDGSIIWVNMVVALLNLVNGNKYNHICLIQDISKRKEVEKSLLESQRSKSVLLANLPGVAYRCNYDKDWTIQFVSKGCFKLTGYHPESLIGNKDLSLNDLILPKYQKLIKRKWEYAVYNKSPLKYEYEIITAEGNKKWVLEFGEAVYRQDDSVEALEGIILDITDRKTIENNLKYNNEHDKWTGLYNRNYLENILTDDLKQDSLKKALVCINISSLQSLTASYGFHYTQDMITKIAKALKVYCSKTQMLFNTYENRFVFYIKSYTDKQYLNDFCQTLSTILENLLKTERIGGGIGVVEIKQQKEQNADQLLKELLIASEKAVEITNKDFGFCFFDSDMEAKILREEEIKKELISIASNNNGKLYLLFQPILDLKTNTICGFEALARLKSKKYGIVPPLEFIPIAEKTKLIIPLGDIIIYNALCFLNKLKERGFDIINVSINVSSIQLLVNDFNQKLFKMIKKMEINPANVGLEITESVFSNDYHTINNILNEIKALGIHISIDDFGTGYSSFARERELNVNCLKIDKYFIDKLLILKSSEAITDDIISMAHKLGHCVIAEGVEYEQQKTYLNSFACDKIQGFHVAMPLDEEKAIEFLTNYNKTSIN